jgi:hypothetical protein
MAGAGYKLFQTGDVLTAAQVNTYLNEQTVMVFANAAARTSALTSVLAEGMVSYLQDTNNIEVYNGSAWVGFTGDITEVQAGTGISIASGTGPIPVITNTATTTIDAEGDLLVGDAADALQRLAIGSNGNVLTVDTSVDGKIKWAAPAGGGKILQVVTATTTTEVTNSTNVYADTNVTASITPSAASSKIMIIANHNGMNKSSADVGNFIEMQLLRGATQVMFISNGNRTSDQTLDLTTSITLSYVDSPNTTSATTYKTQFKNGRNGAAVGAQYGGSRSSITLLEIGA